MKKTLTELRVNKLKEFIVYTDLTEGEICRKLGYPSISSMKEELYEHTGLTISFFLEIKARKKERLSSVTKI